MREIPRPIRFEVTRPYKDKNCPSHYLEYKICGPTTVTAKTQVEKMKDEARVGTAFSSLFDQLGPQLKVKVSADANRLLAGPFITAIKHLQGAVAASNSGDKASCQAKLRAHVEICQEHSLSFDIVETLPSRA